MRSASQALRRKKVERDSFPVSTYPMFSADRSGKVTVPHVLGLTATGQRRPLHYRHYGTGGLNQVRKQIARAIRQGAADDVAGVASIMTLLGVMATPMSDLGRVVEYRQNFRAARRIIAPILNSARAVKRAVRAQERSWKAMQTASDDDTSDDTTENDLADEARPARDYRCGVVVENLVVGRHTLPELHAKPGERILLDSVDTEKIHAVLRSILIHGVNPLPQDDDDTDDSVVLIDGIEYGAAPPAVRRELVGACSIHVPLQRGSVQRLVSYRSPRASVEEVKAMLHRVGLSALVYVEHKGLKTLLKNDGDPWSRADVARLKVARALFGEPALVVLENIDAALDEEGVAMLRRQLADYPGVVLFSSFAPERIFAAGDYRSWSLDSQDAR